MLRIAAHPHAHRMAASEGAKSVYGSPAVRERYAFRSAGSSGSKARSIDNLGVCWMTCGTPHEEGTVAGVCQSRM
jgi:hypothetical protein